MQNRDFERSRNALAGGKYFS